MTGPADDDRPDDDRPDDRSDDWPDEPDWRRRRRLAEVFGDVLPETTSDERDDATAPSDEDAQDRWLRNQVPPHHG